MTTLASGVLMVSLIATGTASRYDPGVFQTVERNRRMPRWAGAHVALLDCDRVGDMVLVCYEEDCLWARVTDCAGVADGGAAWMIRNHIAAELDYRTSVQHWNCVGQPISVYEVLEMAYTPY